MQQLEEQSQQGNTPLDKTILVVEDDDSIGSLLIYALSQETSYHTMLVTDGIQALDIIEALKPCLVITDYRLPHINGIELCDRMHSMEHTSDVPAIIMSAFLPEDEVRKRQLAALHKPFELDELLDKIEDLLQ
ncbi:response regulator [Dictyobacter arantiisoli]|uniref:Response regulatory domain-containing protein n=1 Tax=Dictyobacter arantiisoli TaxID=2014874 RepID=A0A5A5T730_9CHLR|nr:response regulator [Dictyobacter arantiisoli]GCF07207.1 hypothetical protein KDI_07710 [Dictyobacter arantiisoli]